MAFTECYWFEELADYMFANLESVLEKIHAPMANAVIEDMMTVSRHMYIILEEDDGIYKKDDSFKSFHHQAHQSMSRPTLLPSFISIWLKNCVVLSLPYDGILLSALISAVQLVYGRALGLLSAMVYSIQHGL